MTYALAIDPGVSTGVVLFSFGDGQPYRRERAWQFKGGAEALADWMDGASLRFSPARKGWVYGDSTLGAVVVEKFTPHEARTFALTEASVEPLRCEGVLISAALDRKNIIWRSPSAQYFAGGATPVERKKQSRAWLKEHDLHLTGKQVDSPDADDAISATLHSISYLRAIRHRPTLEQFFG